MPSEHNIDYMKTATDCDKKPVGGTGSGSEAVSDLPKFMNTDKMSSIAGAQGWSLFWLKTF